MEMGVHSINAMEMPQSNDDLLSVFISKIKKRLLIYKKINGWPTHIMIAFCPTSENKNRSKYIINDIRKLFIGCEIYMLPIEYKWCGAAKLILENIGNEFLNEVDFICPVSQKDNTKVGRTLKNVMDKIV